jgi:hypothetical protein
VVMCSIYLIDWKFGDFLTKEYSEHTERF